jgi:hypothetical protein
MPKQNKTVVTVKVARQILMMTDRQTDPNHKLISTFLVGELIM